MFNSGSQTILFSELFAQIQARIKNYLELREGNWIDEAKHFLNTTMPILEKKHDIVELINFTKNFCTTTITSSVKKFLPFSEAIGSYAGYQGSSLARDLLAFCEIYELKLKPESQNSIEVLYSDFETPFSLSEKKEQAIITQTSLLNINSSPSDNTDIIQITQDINHSDPLSPNVSLSKDTEATLDAPTSCSHSAQVESKEKNEDKDKAENTNESIQLGILDKISLELFGGEEGQAKLIKDLEMQLKAAQNKIGQLENTNEALKDTNETMATIIQIQSRENKKNMMLFQHQHAFSSIKEDAKTDIKAKLSKIVYRNH